MHIFSPYVVTGSAGVSVCEVFLLCFTRALIRSAQLPNCTLGLGSQICLAEVPWANKDSNLAFRVPAPALFWRRQGWMLGAGVKPSFCTARSGYKHPRLLSQLLPWWHFPLAQISVGMSRGGTGKAGFAHGVVQRVKTQPST